MTGDTFTKAQVYQMLMAEQKEKRRKAHWAWNRYKEIFGVFPYGLAPDDQKPAPPG
jgi:hypothetical protein